DRCLVQNPLIVAGPGVRSGVVSRTFAEMVDILPTLLEYANVKPAHTHFGKSLVPALENPDAVVRFCAFTEGGFGLEDTDLLERAGGEYARKAALQHESPRLVGRAISVRDDRYTYVYRLYESDELYDRAADPQETTNLIDLDDLAPLASRLKTQITDWLFETADVIPWQTDPRFPQIPNGQHEVFDPE
ncbi:MAG TPA: hypothetical protein VJ998_07580, partial [Pseudomonadales bacterium]|nr:hypothetical protein [Pseudomonadales bacterium]